MLIEELEGSRRSRADTKAIDAVITWVDDSAPGYLDQLKAYATAAPDTDPSRTRDNLELLRFGLRAVERNAPWIRHIYLLTCRPQRPGWLVAAHPRLSVIHHDEIMPAAILPTFNSFAIVSHMHLIPGLSENFLYLEDDMLLLRPVRPADFIDMQGKVLVFERGKLTPVYAAIRRPEAERPWNLALAESNRLLDEAFGPARRRYANHVPLLVNKRQWQCMMEKFPDAFRLTRQSRFRARGNIAPEYLYPQLLLSGNLGKRAGGDVLRECCGYVPLENIWPVTAYALWKVRRRWPKWVTLNDNFGARPNRTTERLARDFLNRAFPQPSSFER
ncbi:MAG: hypothetical protein ACKOED_12950 [Aestuariivirga sp.]|uniref:hypothetical protein n=1 Tax=Aestuariivirga sp. TaxID=2650926 RepID=UPI0038D14FF1